MSSQWERALAVAVAVLVVTATVGAAAVGSAGVHRESTGGGNATGPGGDGGPPGENATGTGPDANSTGNETNASQGPAGNTSDGPDGNRTPGSGTGPDDPDGPPGDRGQPGDRSEGCDAPGDCGGPPAWAQRTADGNGPPTDRGGGPADAGGQAVRNVTGSATGDSSNATGSNATARNRTVTVENGTPLALRWAAHDLLDSADLTPGGHAGAGQSARLQRWLNRSFPLYLDERRVTGPGVFDDDRRVAAATAGRAPAVAAHLAASDRELARTAIADATRVRRALDDRNESYDESAVAEDLAAAADAFERGQRLHDRSAPAAISAYREAWVSAQRALDRMDRAVEPNVTLDSRRDPPRNGTTYYILRGSVFDVRGHELDPLTLTLDGDPYRVALDVNTTPGSVGEFAVNLTLAPGSHRVRVNATDPNRDWANGDAHPPATGSALLRLDGDGLPDVYETGVVGSDPLDPDSNASATARNESGNGVLDGLEDHDRDRAATYDEHVQGTDPLDPDTDSDDLADGFELRYASLDPLAADTDGDGTLDPREDPTTTASLSPPNSTTAPTRSTPTPTPTASATPPNSGTAPTPPTRTPTATACSTQRS